MILDSDRKLYNVINMSHISRTTFTNIFLKEKLDMS